MKLSLLAFMLTFSGMTAIFAQTNAAADKETYTKMITDRAAKIVTNLGLTDASKTEKVTVIVRDQYSNLNDIYAARDARVKEIKEKTKIVR
ncbi:DUF3826 domain-containing protein [Pedobacter sp. P26]|uniref:DUF3826 domain-containing protein n=1 Tax=Pedobacter sp. P26 TaxID=3423956 RepID=UPI003D67A70C